MYRLFAADPIAEESPGFIRWAQDIGLTWIAGVLAAILLAHLLASWAAKKGWIYYGSNGGRGGGVALSNALSEFEAVLNPAAEHRIEEEQSGKSLRAEAAQGQSDDDVIVEGGRVFLKGDFGPDSGD